MRSKLLSVNTKPFQSSLQVHVSVHTWSDLFLRLFNLYLVYVCLCHTALRTSINYLHNILSSGSPTWCLSIALIINTKSKSHSFTSVFCPSSGSGSYSLKKYRYEQCLHFQVNSYSVSNDFLDIEIHVHVYVPLICSFMAFGRHFLISPEDKTPDAGFAQTNSTLHLLIPCTW